MRIISGIFKGKKILEPNDYKTRPLKDLTKESVFNIINHSNKFKINLKNANVLDLFSGVGSFGIECLSRGASKVIFCENYLPAYKILKKNLNSLNCNNQMEIFNETVFNFISNINHKIKFDIIFMDPPYKEDKINELLGLIFEKKILKHNGLLIIHRNKKTKDEFPINYKIILDRTYGLSRIFFGKL